MALPNTAHIVGIIQSWRVIGQGYIYLRDHENYIKHDIYKLGRAQNIRRRDATYTTGEFIRGQFIAVYFVPRGVAGIEKKLQDELCRFHTEDTGGTEFYKREIINHIEACLNLHNYEYRKLTNEEIAELMTTPLTRSLARRLQEYLYRIYTAVLRAFAYIFSIITHLNPARSLESPNFSLNSSRSSHATPVNYHVRDMGSARGLDTLVNPVVGSGLRPREDQQEIIDEAVKYFQTNTKGILVLICGVGKTLISLWIAQALGVKSIIIGVPNLLLLQQWHRVTCILFPGVPCLTVNNDIKTHNIVEFLERHETPPVNPARGLRVIVITTYHSANKVRAAVAQVSRGTSEGFVFDMKINDEFHHLQRKLSKVSSNASDAHKPGEGFSEVIGFMHMHKIPAARELSLTATLKPLDIPLYARRPGEGSVVARRGLLWAISKGIVCDYVIQTIVADEDQLMQLCSFDAKNKSLLLGAFAALKSIEEGHTHHLLIYSNKQENSAEIIKYISGFLSSGQFSIPGLAYSNYDSSMSAEEQKTVMANFVAAKCGILTCVYCLGEGWDLPLLDGVVFAENMTSNIRIVQSALRACRKDPHNPSKVAKIILPIAKPLAGFTGDACELREEFESNPDFRKVREVITQMSREDDSIEYKVSVIRFDIGKQNITNSPSGFGDARKPGEGFRFEFELTKFLRLKTITRAELVEAAEIAADSRGMTFARAKKIIAPFEIESKQAYLELCARDPRLPNNPEERFGIHFTNWIDYLSIERKFYTFTECKERIRVHQKDKGLEWHQFDLNKVCRELRILDKHFPPEDIWLDYYNIGDLSELINLSYGKRSRGVDDL